MSSSASNSAAAPTGDAANISSRDIAQLIQSVQQLVLVNAQQQQQISQLLAENRALFAQQRFPAAASSAAAAPRASPPQRSAAPKISQSSRQSQRNASQREAGAILANASLLPPAPSSSAAEASDTDGFTPVKRRKVERNRRRAAKAERLAADSQPAPRYSPAVSSAEPLSYSAVVARSDHNLNLQNASSAAAAAAAAAETENENENLDLNLDLNLNNKNDADPLIQHRRLEVAHCEPITLQDGYAIAPGAGVRLTFKFKAVADENRDKVAKWWSDLFKSFHARNDCAEKERAASTAWSDTISLIQFAGRDSEPELLASVKTAEVASIRFFISRAIFEERDDSKLSEEDAYYNILSDFKRVWHGCPPFLEIIRNGEPLLMDVVFKNSTAGTVAADTLLKWWSALPSSNPLALATLHTGGAASMRFTFRFSMPELASIPPARQADEIYKFLKSNLKMQGNQCLCTNMKAGALSSRGRYQPIIIADSALLNQFYAAAVADENSNSGARAFQIAEMEVPLCFRCHLTAIKRSGMCQKCRTNKDSAGSIRCFRCRSFVAPDDLTGHNELCRAPLKCTICGGKHKPQRCPVRQQRFIAPSRSFPLRQTQIAEISPPPSSAAISAAGAAAADLNAAAVSPAAASAQPQLENLKRPRVPRSKRGNKNAPPLPAPPAFLSAAASSFAPDSAGDTRMAESETNRAVNAILNASGKKKRSKADAESAASDKETNRPPGTDEEKSGDDHG